LDEKIAAIPASIECEFSKMIIERCRNDFSGLIGLPTESREEAVQRIDSFYQNDFIQLFSDYALGVIKKIGDKLGVS